MRYNVSKGLFAILLCWLTSFSCIGAEENAGKPRLQPGRYILITKGQMEGEPMIVNITRTGNSLEISAEESRYVDLSIREDAGSILIQLKRNEKEMDLRLAGDAPKQGIFTFAGIPSETTPGAIEGACSVVYYYFKGGSPGATSGTFLLFPIGKK